MTEGDLVEELRLFRQEMKETRQETKNTRTAVETLARRGFWQKVFNWAVVLLFVLVGILGYLGWTSAARHREAIRHEACIADQTSVRKARLANEIFINAVITVLAPSDPEDRLTLERLKNEILSQQDELLPISECD